MKNLRLAVMAVAVLTAVVCVPGRATASDNSDVMAVINSAVADFNKGDMKGWEALCTSDAPVVDNIAPYEFATCADWWNAHAAFIKKNGISGEMATPGTPWHLVVTGDRAYTAIPTNYAYKQKGKTIKTSGILTIALQKTASGWLMTGWSWSQR
jgi:ketosteroid isomerase-like protein